MLRGGHIQEREDKRRSSEGELDDVLSIQK
jgi:hypothetical protein